MGTNNSTTAYAPWASVQCATTGASHVQDGIPCQDRTYAYSDNGVSAFALADGAGSAVLSHYGAETVTSEICYLLCERFDDFFQSQSAASVKTQIIEHLIACLTQTAADRNCKLGDLASTLLAVAVSGDRYILLHIGDGVIGYCKNDEVKVASAPTNGEFCNTTIFVTSRDAAEKMRIAKGTDDQINGFVLMSDGSEASLYSKQKRQLAPVLQHLIYRLSITSEPFLEPSVQRSLDEVVSHKTRDDCSLLLAARMDRAYDDLSVDELDDYYDIDTTDLSENSKKLRRKRFTDILNLLAQDKNAADLTSALGLKNTGYFVKKWMQPLLDLGYVIEVEPQMYHRTVSIFEEDALIAEKDADALMPKPTTENELEESN